MSAEQDRLVRQQISGLLYSGDVARAEALCLEHLKQRPRDHEAMALLAHILKMSGQYRTAEVTLTKAIAQDPKRPDYQALMAEILTTTGRHREALGRYDRALKIKPDFEAAIAGKGETYLRMGKPEKTLRVIEDAPVTSQDSPLLAIVHARSLVRTGQSEQAELIARRHLPGDKLNVEHQRSLWFAAALAAERQGELARAAETYQTANASTPSEWDAEEAAAHRRTAEEVFGTPGFPNLPRSECQDDSLVFIVGMLRSGSTLTEQIIDAHPQAIGLGELETLPVLLSTLPQMLGTALPYPACLEETNELSLTTASTAYLNEVTPLARKAQRRVDKQLGNFSLLGLIALLFPKARIIHCRRHPMDVGLSCWTQKFAPGTNPWTTTLPTIAAFYREYEAWMDLWKRVLPIPIHEVRYEELVADLEGQGRQIIDFCGLEWNDTCLRFWETGRTVLTLSSDQVRQPLYQRSVGRHTAWGTHLSPLRTALGDSIERYEAIDG